MKNNIFGQNLRNIRTLRKISLHALGKELDVTGSAISAWELGKKEPNFDMLKKIANYFMVSTDYLLNHQVLENEEQKKEVVTQLANKLYAKSQDIPVFEKELLSYIAYLDFKKKSEQTALENDENEIEDENTEKDS
ncbi:helix-turn-helix domain-containing protein [Bacillus cereus]|uniref:Transcriptional regulator n=1 Tax=Bacillus cereus TaxID=1396 RepID=A0A9X6VGT3_BACCE|nr:helix-turn-helix transcriptional regulator [Bacillus cereus]PFD16684.1 transcriptional regulator [Bacillus cereus]PFW60467.1 transcriptional regulator [Bacillus sp. AFS075960]